MLAALLSSKKVVEKRFDGPKIFGGYKCGNAIVYTLYF